MIGTLVAVADGSINQRDVYEMLTIPSHCSWNHKVNPVPAHGLYLLNVEYPEEIYANDSSVNDEMEKEKSLLITKEIIKN